ncbi:hypothetical protein [Thermophagus xiamenensis]|jgi:hypothetical protein|uniref:Alpha-glucosidase n=1 Tax=Thermophagus xiamenensis TaxID=385682 RepID=A0A1I2DU60_9BACT|nr:hypothetical protein [Thermophagus xiamenensis]SFE83803.1 hypothetical protein SAMN05444380_12017 [Thermophagus xiamenensis]
MLHSGKVSSLTYSPLQMAADLPENYVDQPAFRFIREVPVDWDDTIWHRVAGKPFAFF